MRSVKTRNKANGPSFNQRNWWSFLWRSEDKTLDNYLFALCFKTRWNIANLRLSYRAALHVVKFTCVFYHVFFVWSSFLIQTSRHKIIFFSVWVKSENVSSNTEPSNLPVGCFSEGGISSTWRVTLAPDLKTLRTWNRLSLSLCCSDPTLWSINPKLYTANALPSTYRTPKTQPSE